MYLLNISGDGSGGGIGGVLVLLVGGVMSVVMLLAMFTYLECEHMVGKFSPQHDDRHGCDVPPVDRSMSLSVMS